MEYLFVIWNGGEGADEPDREALVGEMSAWVGGIAEQGNLRGGAPLQPAEQGKSMRKRQGRVTTVDGPYAETKEVIGGYILVELASIEDAVALADGCPALPYGGVEIREIIDIH